MSTALKPSQGHGTTAQSPGKPALGKNVASRIGNLGRDPIDLAASIGSCALLFTAATVMFSPLAGGLLALAVVAYMVITMGRKRFPQAVGIVVTVAAFETVAIIFSTLLTPLMLLSGSPELGAGFILASPLVALAAVVARSINVHRGWTVAFAHIPLSVGIFVSGMFPGHVSFVAAISTLVALLVVYLRARMAKAIANPTRKQRASRIGALVLSGGLLSGMAGFAAPPTQANAIDWTFGMKDAVMCGMFSPSLGTQPIGTGVESFVPNRNLGGFTPQNPADNPGFMNVPMVGMDSGSDLSSFTLFEIVGLRGMQYINWVKDKDGESTVCGFPAWASVTAGGVVNGLGLMFLQLVIALKETSQASSPFTPLFADFNRIVGSLWSIFTGIAGLGILVGIMVGGYRALRGNSAGRAFGQVGGVLGTALIGGLAYGGPAVQAATGAFNGTAVGAMLGTIDQYGAIINSWVADTTLSSINDSREDAMCTKPSGGENTGQRYSSCLLAETFAYQPWANVTFGPEARYAIESEKGSAPDGSGEAVEEGAGPLPCYNNFNGCNDMRTYLLTQVGGPDITEAMAKCLTTAGFDEQSDETDNYGALVACEPYHAVAADLIAKSEAGGPQASMLTSYRGQAGFMAHMINAQMTTAGILVVGIGLGIFAVRTIYWHGRLFVLWLFGPVVLAFGTFRGGQQGVTWLFNLIETAAVRIVYGIITTILIVAVAAVSSMEYPGGIKMIIMAFLVFVIMGMIKKFEAWAKPPLADSEANPNMFGGAFLGTAAGAMVPAMVRGSVGAATKVAGGVGKAGLKTAGMAARPARNLARHGVENVQGRFDAWRTDRHASGASFASREAARSAQRATDAGGQFGQEFTSFRGVSGSPTVARGGAAVPTEMGQRSRTGRVVDGVRRTAGSTRRLFSDPNGETRTAVHQREALVRQTVRDENVNRDVLQKVNSAITGERPIGPIGRDVPRVSRKETRQLRRAAKKLTPDQQRATLRGSGTMDERLRRLAERRNNQR